MPRCSRPCNPSPTPARAECMRKISVLVADEHSVVRWGIIRFIGLNRQLRIVGECDNGRAAVRLARKLKPDLVVMDLHLPQLNGAAVTKQMLKMDAKVKVLILTAAQEQHDVERALWAGVSGYCIKASCPAKVSKAIRTVARGGRFFSPEIMQFVKNLMPESNDLTAREIEVLQLVTEGKRAKETASILELTQKTVEAYKNSLMLKLNIRDIAGLTRYAVRTGICGG